MLASTSSSSSSLRSVSRVRKHCGGDRTKCPAAPRLPLSTKSEAVQITLALAKCKSWPQVKALFEQHQAELWHINVAAIHTRLAQVVWPTSNTAVLPPPSEAAVLGQAQWDVIDAFASSEEIPKRAYQVRAMERLEAEAFEEFYSSLVYATGRSMRRGMAAREICTIARAAARLGIANTWLLDVLREASLALLCSHEDSLPEHLQSQAGKAPDLRQMAQLAYSFGVLRYTPEGAWVPAILSASHTAMQKAAAAPSSSRPPPPPASASSASSAAAATAPDPLEQWRAEVQQRLLLSKGGQTGRRARTGAGQASETDNFAAEAQPRPSNHRGVQQRQQQWGQQGQNSAAGHAGEEHRRALMHSLANLLYALVVLMGVPPPFAWMRQFYSTSSPCLRLASGAELVQVVRALQVLSSYESLEQQQQQNRQSQQDQQLLIPPHVRKSRCLCLKGVPQEWATVLLESLRQRARETPPGKLKVLQEELASRVEAARQES